MPDYLILQFSVNAYGQLALWRAYLSLENFDLSVVGQFGMLRERSFQPYIVSLYLV